MTTVFLIFTGTVILAVWQGRLIRNLANCYRQPKLQWPEGVPLPKAAVVLSLRGHDPFLLQCIRNLAGQDYPDFRIDIVVDSDVDPAWEAIDHARLEFGDVITVSTLSDRRPNCSLKNSSILQAVQSLPADVEVVAFVDADAVVSSTWLRDLVLPLADPLVGCSTGIRWFAPMELTPGNRLRCYWNHIAASMIYAADVPWGGSMAVRRQILDSGLTDEWSRMFCEDAHTINHLRRRGLKIAYVPDATIPNQEIVSVSSCIRFINRQMLIFRLYSKSWNWLMCSIFFAAALRITHDLLILHSLWTQQFLQAALLIACHPLVLLVTRFEASRLDCLVREKLESNGRTVHQNPLPDLFGYFCVEIVFLTSTITALLTRVANWRGIEYRIRSGEDIELVEYQPYGQGALAVATSESTVV